MTWIAEVPVARPPLMTSRSEGELSPARRVFRTILLTAGSRHSCRLPATRVSDDRVGSEVDDGLIEQGTVDREGPAGQGEEPNPGVALPAATVPLMSTDPVTLPCNRLGWRAGAMAIGPPPQWTARSTGARGIADDKSPRSDRCAAAIGIVRGQDRAAAPRLDHRAGTGDGAREGQRIVARLKARTPLSATFSPRMLPAVPPLPSRARAGGDRRARPL